jgi:hypothetical protein
MPRRLLLNRDLAIGQSQAAAVAALTRLASAAGLALLIVFAPATGLQAASALLESVKQNPALAKQMCARFKQLNAAGQSATSSESIAAVASAQGLSPMDAEVLITYVIGLNCPDVR